MKKMLIGLVISFLIIGAGAYYVYGGDSEEDDEKAVKYSYVNVEKGDISIDFMADGQIDMPIRAYSFKTSGVVKNINVSLSQEVTSGETLASLDTEEMNSNLIEAKLNLQNALLLKEKNESTFANSITNYNYQLNRLKTTYQVLKATLDDMYAISSIYASNDIESAKLNYETALLDYENYQSSNRPVSSTEVDNISIEKAKLAIENIKTDLENAELTSTSSGTVIDILQNVNDSISSSEIILKIEEEGKIYVTAEIQEIDILNIEINQKSYVEVEAMIGQVFEAKVIHINRDPIIDNNGIVSYEVTLELIEVNEDIMDAMTVTSTFVMAEKLDVLVIPNKSVKKVASKQVVNVVTGENTAEERVIITGLTDGKNVEVLSGLEVGEKLVYEN